jgi:phospholipase C
LLKAPGYEDGHPGYSEPADEQQFIANVTDELMRSPDWKSTAVIVNWDDSDGWYDHVYSGVTNRSLSPAENLTNTHLSVSGEGTSGQCGGSPRRQAVREPDYGAGGKVKARLGRSLSWGEVSAAAKPTCLRRDARIDIVKILVLQSPCRWM